MLSFCSYVHEISKSRKNLHQFESQIRTVLLQGLGGRRRGESRWTKEGKLRKCKRLPSRIITFPHCALLKSSWAVVYVCTRAGVNLHCHGLGDTWHGLLVPGYKKKHSVAHEKNCVCVCVCCDFFKLGPFLVFQKNL